MNTKFSMALMPIYMMVLSGFVVLAVSWGHVATTMSVISPNTERHIVIIDAGHGGVDGGATSCTGVLESNINLEIALKLNDMMHLLGIETLMIRETDISVYTEGETIAHKKVSDLKERVRIINQANNPLLISIHQNTFPQEKYWGVQVFYAKTDGSMVLAEQLQESFRKVLSPNNQRKAKKSEGIYLMEKVSCPAVLIECGFLSNPVEEARLRSDDYQKELCSVIACICSQYLMRSADQDIL